MASAREAAQSLAERSGSSEHDVAIVLGSGWVPAVDALGPATADIATTELPGFRPPAVEGHAGRLRAVTVSGRRVWPFSAALICTRAPVSTRSCKQDRT